MEPVDQAKFQIVRATVPNPQFCERRGKSATAWGYLFRRPLPEPPEALDQIELAVLVKARRVTLVVPVVVALDVAPTVQVGADAL